MAPHSSSGRILSSLQPLSSELSALIPSDVGAQARLYVNSLFFNQFQFQFLGMHQCCFVVKPQKCVTQFSISVRKSR